MSIQTNITNEQVDLYFSDLIRKVNQRFVTGVTGNISAAKQRAQWKDTYQEIGQILSVLSRSADGSIAKTEPISVLNSLPDGVYEAKTDGLYPFGLNAKEGFYTRFKKTGTNWTLYSEIKSATLDGVIALGNSAGVTGGVVWNYIHSYSLTEFSSSYSENIGYRLNSMVYSGNSFLISKIENNKQPLTDPNAWEVINFGSGNNSGETPGSYPIASSTVVGGVKIGWNSEITVDGQLRVFTLYNYDGTLSNNRNVNLGGYTIRFFNGNTQVKTLVVDNTTNDNLTPFAIYVKNGEWKFNNEFGLPINIGGGARVVNGAFNPPTQSQLTSLGLVAGDIYNCTATNQRTFYDGVQLTSWNCTQAEYNILSSAQKNAVKLINIVIE